LREVGIKDVDREGRGACMRVREENKATAVAAHTWHGAGKGEKLTRRGARGEGAWASREGRAGRAPISHTLAQHFILSFPSP
jgi:hypothetical protein